MDQILWEAAKSGYVKRYKCAYCEKRLDRQSLIRHIEKDHEAEIPEGYSPTRVVFNLINKKDHGNCVICGAETKWDENKARYDRICERPECMNTYKQNTKERMIAIYGTDNLLNDPQQQQKMLANRRISGKYKWSDGMLLGYTGTYEKKALQFLDKVMNFKSEDIITPGPIVEYEYGGKKHFWILDIYIPSYKLVIDVKDGQNNKNNREMKEYREKQIAKEKAIVDQKKYNYLRLTDNNFGQLMSMLAELKMQLMEDNTADRIIRINEEMFSGINSMMPMGDWKDDGVIICNILKKNVFSQLAVSDNILMDEMVIQDSNGTLHKVDKTYLYDCTYNLYKVNGHKDAYKKLVSECGTTHNEDYIISEIFGIDPYTKDEWICREDVNPVSDVYEYIDECCNVAKANAEVHKVGLPILNEQYNSDHIVQLQDSTEGYYLYNSITGMRSSTKENIKDFSQLEYDIIKGGLL